MAGRARPDPYGADALGGAVYGADAGAGSGGAGGATDRSAGLDPGSASDLRRSGGHCAADADPRPVAASGVGGARDPRFRPERMGTAAHPHRRRAVAAHRTDPDAQADRRFAVRRGGAVRPCTGSARDGEPVGRSRGAGRAGAADGPDRQPSRRHAGYPAAGGHGLRAARRCGCCARGSIRIWKEKKRRTCATYRAVRFGCSGGR